MNEHLVPGAILYEKIEELYVHIIQVLPIDRYDTNDVLVMTSFEKVLTIESVAVNDEFETYPAEAFHGLPVCDGDTHSIRLNEENAGKKYLDPEGRHIMGCKGIITILGGFPGYKSDTTLLVVNGKRNESDQLGVHFFMNLEQIEDLQFLNGLVENIDCLD